jgi:hypothetical protein
LTQSYSHVQYGSGIWQLNEATLQPESNLGSSLWPAGLEQPRRTGMTVHWLKSMGLISMAGTFLNSTSTPPKDPSTVYALRWETMPENQDQPRTPIPAPTPLVLYTFKDPNVITGIPKSSASRKFPEQILCLHNGYLQLRNREYGVAALTVTNLQGRIIFEKAALGTASIDLRAFAEKGVVLVRVVAGGKTVFQSLQIARKER